jgi:hypothetical protein
MKYIFGTSKCIRNRNTYEVFRTDFDTATRLVAGKGWSYTSKSAWKSGGRKYYEESDWK